MLIDNQVMVELKSVARLEPIHEAPRTGDVRFSAGDPGRLLADFGLSSETGMQEGIRLLIRSG